MSNEAAKQLGKLGGNKTKEKYGKEHYQRLAKETNEKRWGKKAEQVALPKTNTKSQKLKVCKHGILLNVGKCKYGCI